MSKNLIDLGVGARVLTNRGPVVVVDLERHGVQLKDSAGQTFFAAFSQIEGQVVTDGQVQPLHASLYPWFAQLPADVQRLARFREECVLEARTGFRSGVREFAQPGEPFCPFGDGFGLSLTKRYQAMSKVVSFERTVDRSIMRRVYDGELQSAAISARTMLRWDKLWTRDGLAGLVDGRSTRDRQGFEAIDPRIRDIAQEVFASFDGRRSATNRDEIERLIRVRAKREGIDQPHLPQRLFEEYLSFHWRALGRTTRAHKSRSLRKVSGTESYAAHHPSACATDLTRGDNLLYDPVQDRPISVEVATMLSISTRVVVAHRVFPRSANAFEVGLLMYDALRQYSMVVEDGPDGPRIDDWRWVGIPESLELTGNPTVTQRRRAVKADLSLWGEHTVPGVMPTSLRSDHGSIFVSQQFRSLLDQFGITLQLSRGKKPSDNPHVERLHETYQRFYQQTPSFKGRGVYERGSWVGVVADEPMCTVEKYERDFRRFLTLDYHRQPHDGLTLPGAPGIRLTPLEMWDALSEATGRITVPTHPDLIYQFLPVIWLTPGHAGVEFKNLTYDNEVLQDFRSVRKGAFREQDSAVPFHHDPRDMTRLWFRHPDTDRIHEIGWKARHLIDAPLVDVVLDRALARIRERGGNRALGRHTVRDQIIEEIQDITTPRGNDDWRGQLSAATLRWNQAQQDHGEVALAHLSLEEHRQQPGAAGTAPSPLRVVPQPAAHLSDEPWPDYSQAATDGR